MLELEHIQKAFDGVPVLKDLSLQVEDGEIVSILGPSGCGKTTLLNIILGIVDADQGEIRYSGEDLTRTPMEKRGFNIVFQDYALFPNLNVQQNITYGLRNKPGISSREEVDELIDLLGLREHLGKRIEYAAAGMTKEAIQKMYDYDRQQFNSERTFIERTQEFTAPAYESSEEEASPLMLRYQDAITVTDTYHETKSRFAWIGEIENEQLLTALETLKTEDLEIITMYAYEGYDITEISKVYGVSRPTISIKIKRITKFLKNFNFNATN